MATREPSDADRLLSHLVVAAVAGLIGGKISGLPGAIVGAVVAAVAHYELDAPFAGVIADIG
jgi:hypothetical protein